MNPAHTANSDIVVQFGGEKLANILRALAHLCDLRWLRTWGCAMVQAVSRWPLTRRPGHYPRPFLV